MIRRGPGLLGTAARTAVVAGTATAVSGGMIRHRQQRDMQAQQAAAYQQQQQQEAQTQAYAQQAPTAAPAPAAGEPDLASKIKQLADLNAAGVLSDAEFAAAKAKLLS